MSRPLRRPEAVAYTLLSTHHGVSVVRTRPTGSRIRRVLAKVGGVAVLATVALAPHADATAPAPAVVRPAALLPPCPVDDSPGPCYWNAATRGNGEGMSFIVTRKGRVILLDRPLLIIRQADQ